MTLLASYENREYAMYNFIYPLLANDNFSILSSTTSNKPHKGNRKKRPMGHIAHLRKQLKSINTYDYIITLKKRRKKTLFTL